jgi:hypothetical protein
MNEMKVIIVMKGKFLPRLDDGGEDNASHNILLTFRKM